MSATSSDMTTELAAAQVALAGAAKDALKNTSLWIEVGKYLYKKITDRPPLSKVDLANYNSMCSLYKHCMQSDAIPVQWALDDRKCPIYSSEFDEAYVRLRGELVSFDKCQHGLKTQILSIVGLVSRLFESLSKRTNFGGIRAHYRPDGFEYMFLNELTMWLVIDLPRYSITDKKTADMVQRRIQYCQEMQDDVLEFRADSAIANPKNILPSIIISLTVLHQNLLQAHSAATFSDKALLIDGHMVDMVRGTFNILYLMLDEVDQHEFQVYEFFNPGEGRKKNNDVLTSSLLGQWLMQTCSAAGIFSNDYMNTKDISHALIDSHINMDISTIKKIDQIGCCEFVWRTNYQLLGGPSKSTQAETYLNTQAPAFLHLIIELHRSILRLSYIRTALRSSIHLNIAYGEIWLFAKKEGETMFGGLMDALTHAVEHHRNVLDQFWQEYYTNTYEPFAASQHKDKTDKVHKDIMDSGKFYALSHEKIAEIQLLAKETYDHAKNVQRRLDVRKKEKHFLIENLYAYLSNVPGYDPVKLVSLRTIMQATSLSISIGREDATSKAEKAQLLATTKLCQYGGYSLGELPTKLLDDVAQHLLLTQEPSTSEAELNTSQAKYDAAIEAAKAYKRTQKESESEQARKTYWNAILELCQYGGYSLEHVPLQLAEDVYQYLMLMPGTPEAELFQAKYDEAIEEAKAYKLTQKEPSEGKVANAKLLATVALCQHGGYSPGDIPSALFDDAFDHYMAIIEGAPEAELKSRQEKFNAAIEKAKVHKLIHTPSTDDKKIDAKSFVTQLLCQHGGYRPEDIPLELFEPVYLFFMSTPDTPEVELKILKEKYDFAMDEAKKHKLTTEKGPDTPTPTKGTDMTTEAEMQAMKDLVFTKESLRTALLVRDLFARSIQERSSEFISDKKSTANQKYFEQFEFVPLSTLTPLQNRLKGLAALIYKDILKPYSGVAENSVISFFSGYLFTRDLLRKHYSRMVSALYIVATAVDLYDANNMVQLELIDQYLREGLAEMSLELPGINQTSLLRTVIPKLSPLVKEIDGDQVLVIVGSVAIYAARREADLAIAAAAESREQTDAATARADAATAKANAATAKANAAIAKANAAAAKFDAAEATRAVQRTSQQGRTTATSSSNNPNALFTTPGRTKAEPQSSGLETQTGASPR